MPLIFVPISVSSFTKIACCSLPPHCRGSQQGVGRLFERTEWREREWKHRLRPGAPPLIPVPIKPRREVTLLCQPPPYCPWCRPALDAGDSRFLVIRRWRLYAETKRELDICVEIGQMFSPACSSYSPPCHLASNEEFHNGCRRHARSYCDLCGLSTYVRGSREARAFDNDQA